MEQPKQVNVPPRNVPTDSTPTIYNRLDWIGKNDKGFFETNEVRPSEKRRNKVYNK
jgi:hypothetical protein